MHRWCLLQLKLSVWLISSTLHLLRCLLLLPIFIGLLLLLFFLTLEYNDFLCCIGLCMDLCVDSSMLAKWVIVTHKFTTCLLIQTRFRKWHDQKASDDFEYMLEGPFGWVPVPFQGVHTDLSSVNSHIWMEDLRKKESFGCALWEPTFNDEFASENATLVCRLHYRYER